MISQIGLRAEISNFTAEFAEMTFVHPESFQSRIERFALYFPGLS